jgi:hypothetical protein
MHTFLAALALSVLPQARPVELPVGSAPAPVAAPHFPDRLHAFVWRNWTLVPPERMAKAVGATSEQIKRIGRSMGLPEAPPITEETRARSYLTVIRRNWHLLPYEQLVELLGVTPERLAHLLREDDFLYIKLGSHKPKCEPLRYTEPDAAAQARAAEIARTVRETFGARTGLSHDPLFSFVRRLSAAPAKRPAKRSESRFSPRFGYSYFALFGDPLLESHADPFPDGYLATDTRSG